MSERYTIQQGDSVAKLAFEHGLAPDTIWQHGENAELRTLRKEMNVLLPGDVIFIPDRRDGKQSADTDLRHRFRRHGVPMLFSLQLIGPDGPRKNKPYVLVVDDNIYRGNTDGDGRIRRYLPNDSRSGHLSVGVSEVETDLFFGHMDPIDTEIGVRKRLHNMGYACLVPEGENGPALEAVIAAFQRSIGLPDTGELDAQTRSAIQLCHDEPDELWKRREQNFQRLLQSAAMSAV